MAANDDNKKNKPEIDKISGVETTGHDWDGIKELNTPTPRWWLIVWVVCIIYAIGYMFVYPTWPTLKDHTKGLFGWSSYKQLKEQQSDIIARKTAYLDRFKQASFDDIKKEPDLYAFAIAGGKSAFKTYCTACHGSGAAGIVGQFPNLNDDDWLWGGTLDDIYTTIKYGIRSTNDDTRVSQMSAFGKDEILTGDEIGQVVSHVLSLSGKSKDSVKGAEIFADNCTACHGENAEGNRDLGAPNLSDAIWLYGGDREAVTYTVTNARAGVMPAWVDRLSNDTIRQLTLYIHSLGGGE